MKPRPLKYVIYGGLIMMSSNMHGQFGGNNLFEFQAGNVPGDEPGGLLANYDQLNLHYRYGGLKASGRFEYFLNTFPERRYISPSQLQLEYSRKNLEFRAGNYFEMLGNGLLLRAYDIPGSVFESQGYRVRHGFYRDLFGLAGEYAGEVFRLKALYGKPLASEFPPTLGWKERRAADVVAVNPGISLGEQHFDVNYLYHIFPSGSDHYTSVQAAGNLPYDFSYNLELAAELGTGQPVFSAPESTHALYASLAYTGEKLGGSLEFKDYRNFLIGSGFNDPPTLVREHAYKVLNRSTHVPLLTNERGFQAELYWRSEKGHVITLNTSRARNELSGTTVFEEYYAEMYSPLGKSASLKIFTDYARDPFKSEPHRLAAGGILESPVFEHWSTLTELEYQYIKRGGFLPGPLYNTALIAGLSRGVKFSVSLTWEFSTDPYLTDRAGTREIERKARHWVGVDTKYRINRRHTLYVFAGQRRGGPACTSGICLEVLDFTGVEIKLSSKF